MTATWRLGSTEKVDPANAADVDDVNAESSLLTKTETSGTFSLKNISCHVGKGELIAIVGPVGAGKSSVLMSILGELPADQGSILVRGSVGYVAQLPWVFSGTVRENVLFDKPYDKEHYEKVLQACALMKDMELMSSADQTRVGERGLFLSGGQKARLTLARAVYADADVYLLDDPLSAVDTEVGRHLFTKCICEHLADKTRILVTHQLQYLKKVDRILIMRDGCFIDAGSYNELQSHAEFTRLLSEEEEEEKPGEEKCEFQLKGDEAREEIEDEDKMKGRVGLHVYGQYIKFGRGAIMGPIIILFGILYAGLFSAADWYLALWAESFDAFPVNVSDVANMSAPLHGSSFNTTAVTYLPQLGTNISIPSITIGPVMDTLTNQNTSDFMISANTTDSPGNVFYMHLYIGLYIGFLVCAFVFAQFLFRFCTIASRHLHDKMFEKILGAKTYFFDSNPVGRILNRFARDIGFMDDMLPRVMFAVFELGIRLCGFLVINCIINPWLLIPMVPLMIVILMIRYYAVQTTRDMKRIEAVARSPVYSHVSDTLNGLQTVRAFRMEEKFITTFETYQDQHTIAWFLFLSTYRWFGIRSLFIVIIYLNIVIYVSILLRDQLLGGLVGLSLTYCIAFAEPFEFFIRMTAELENYMTSVERVLAYTNLEQEADKTSMKPPPTDWPSQGSITFHDLSLRYSADSPTILKNISCHIQTMEKVGIVGRTGAGKSSLLSALLRLAEPTGKIWIDGVDVTAIGLHELRSCISVIPQDPVLFSGSLRRNLDPFDEDTDENLWKALEEVELKEKIQSMSKELYTEMSEAGKNFSVGQRQLVCLARAILRHNKILVLDEATANVDHRTDELIQRTIREKFQACTVITVAHRLQTIMDSHRVMVMDEGQVKEFDSPYVLLQRKDSMFSKLVELTGTAQAAELSALAKQSFQLRRSRADEMESALQSALDGHANSISNIQPYKELQRTDLDKDTETSDGDENVESVPLVQLKAASISENENSSSEEEAV